MKKIFLFILVLSLISCVRGGGAQGNVEEAIVLSIHPSKSTVPAGGTQQFTAIVQNTSNTAVTWQVNAITGGDATFGTISESGLYTAPLSPSETGMVTITAISQADPTKSNSAFACIVYSNATLSGQYAFSFKGKDSSGFFLIAGSFNADGNGTITNGVEDINHSTGIFSNLPFTGTYSINPDGRGSATITSAWGTTTFQFVALSSLRILFIAFDTFTTGIGSIEKQDTTAFSNSVIGGEFSFSLSGLGFSGHSRSVAGRFTMDGQGGISLGAEDNNDGGVIGTNIPFTGAYSVGLNGRGTATIIEPTATLRFSFYVISANRIILISLDLLPAMIGEAERQESMPFTNSSLSGDFVFLFEGESTLGSIASAGRFTSIGSGVIVSGVLDQNEAGIRSENIGFAGLYKISSNGRGTAILTSSLGRSNFAFYMVDSEKAFFIQINTFAVTNGIINTQQERPFITGSISGNFGFALAGVSAISGQFIANGIGNLSGTEDINSEGALWQSESLSGSYMVYPSGRGEASFITPNKTAYLRFYIYSRSNLVIVGMDSSEVLRGIAVKRY